MKGRNVLPKKLSYGVIATIVDVVTALIIPTESTRWDDDKAALTLLRLRYLKQMASIRIRIRVVR